MNVPRLSDSLPSELFVKAAEIYRIRSAMDCLIAAIALDNGAPFGIAIATSTILLN